MEGIQHLLGLRWDLFFQPVPIVFFIGCLAITYFIWVLWDKHGRKPLIPGPETYGASDDSIIEFYSWVPVILGVHIGVSLLVNGIQGQLFNSENILKGTFANWIGLAEIFVAISFIYGTLTRPASILLVSLWFWGFELLGISAMLESIQYLGYGLFFYLAGRGPYSIDRLLFPRLEPTASYEGSAFYFLRSAVGLNLIILGFTQKFANIPFASDLLDQHPFLNFTHSLVLPISNETFVLIAAAAEVLAGFLICFGIFPRIVIILTLIAINASLTIYNWPAFIDYLPFNGALAILLIWEPNENNQKLWISALRKDHLKNLKNP